LLKLSLIISQVLVSGTVAAIVVWALTKQPEPSLPRIENTAELNARLLELENKLNAVTATLEENGRGNAFSSASTTSVDITNNEATFDAASDTSAADFPQSTTNGNAESDQFAFGQPGRRQPELRERLIQSGFDEQEADWVVQQANESQSDRLQRIYQARRQRAEQRRESGLENQSPFQDLRDRLGDDNFKRYLAANGLPTSIQVDSILPASPGESAGLEVGDKITHYDGERVFNVSQLNNLTVLGEEGENVLVEVERDGNSVQVTLPRGPIGISSRR